ncbi:MAG: cation diffusion facilitator family transporter [Pseudomonadota bacterium]
MSHDHGHAHLDPRSGDRRVLIAIGANGVLTVAQIAGGLFAGSLALIADALHNLSDMASLVIAFAARRIARRPADARMTFGYGRIEMVAALINYTTLILVGFYLIYEGAMRLLDPPAVQGWTVVVLGGVALVVDALTAGLTWSMQKGSVNIRALFLHNLSDALASVAVIVGGTLIVLHDLRWVDPAITIAIAVYILWLAFAEIGGPIRMLMLGSPPDIDGGAVIATMRSVAGVRDVHHVHLWQMQEHEAALDCHVVLDDAGWTRIEPIKAEIKARLLEHFGIGHSSLEFEHVDHAHENADLFGHGGGLSAPRAPRPAAGAAGRGTCKGGAENLS